MRSLPTIGIQPMRPSTKESDRGTVTFELRGPPRRIDSDFHDLHDFR